MGNSAAPVLSFERVTLEAGGRPAFADTSWEIRRGEQWAIVGPNGAGKSLLVAALSGRVRPRSGRVSHHFVQGAARIDGSYGYFRPGTLTVVSTALVQELTDSRQPESVPPGALARQFRCGITGRGRNALGRAHPREKPVRDRRAHHRS
jgi:ABC-type molybdenum transport system ATPase subunit/photorepair protein PhrA